MEFGQLESEKERRKDAVRQHIFMASGFQTFGGNGAPVYKIYPNGASPADIGMGCLEPCLLSLLGDLVRNL